MNLLPDVLNVLDQVLSLKGRAVAFDSTTALLGAVPELDSMAVVGLIAALEDRFGVQFDDADLDGRAFASVGSLVALIERAMNTPP